MGLFMVVSAIASIVGAVLAGTLIAHVNVMTLLTAPSVRLDLVVSGCANLSELIVEPWT